VAGNHRIKGTTLGELARFPELTDLDLSETAIEDDALIEIAKIQNLRSLNLTECTSLVGKKFSCLYTLKDLKVLALSGSGINLDFVDVKPFKKLQKLCVGAMEVSEENVKGFLQNPSLISLFLDRDNISNSIIKLIAANKKIEELSLKDVKGITEDGLQFLKSTNVNNLSLSRVQLSEDSIRTLTEMKNLHELYVPYCGVTGTQARELLQKTRIARLTVSDPVTAREIVDLNKQFPGRRVSKKGPSHRGF
jgi:hypothetical protein